MAAKPSSDDVDDESDACAGLTAFQTDMLAVLADGSRHGLGVKAEMEERYETVHHGRLYPNLDTLVEKGLVEKSERDKRTNEYALTDQGRCELEDYQKWITAFLDSAVNDEAIVTDGGVDVGSSEQNPNGVPNAKNHPVKAAEKILRRTRGEMSGDLYDESEEVREWAMNIEWAFCALAEHEDSDYDSVEEAADYE